MFRHATTTYEHVMIRGVMMYKWVVTAYVNDQLQAIHMFDSREEATQHSDRWMHNIVAA